MLLQFCVVYVQCVSVFHTLCLFAFVYLDGFVIDYNFCSLLVYLGACCRAQNTVSQFKNEVCHTYYNKHDLKVAKQNLKFFLIVV